MSIDIVIAPQSQFDGILQDVRNAASLDVVLGAEVSIDDVVTIVAIYRNSLDDRPAWWKIRRELNARFSIHPEITTRTLALIPDLFRDELSTFTPDEIKVIAAKWLAQEGATPKDAIPKNLEQAIESLSALVAACQKARTQSDGVFLRTNQPPNAFETAFSQLSGKLLTRYRKAFDKMSDAQKYESHQKYNYYHKQGLENSLALALRDMTRRGATKVNLKTDQRTIQRHIGQCVKAYCETPRPISGSSDAPITLIMLTFDIEYEGYVDLSFDTRDDALTNVRWEDRTENCLDFCHWNEGVERLGCDELPLQVTLPDGTKVVVAPDADDDVFETYIGDMLRGALISARDSGAFAKLPLADPCYMLVGGTHANYAWPADLEFNAECRANRKTRK